MVTQKLEMYNGQQYLVTYNRNGEEIESRRCVCNSVDDPGECWIVG